MMEFFVHNTDTCIGCCACQVACKDHNNLDAGEFFRRVKEVRGRFSSVTCRHCEEPACLAACPVSAMTREEDGTVRVTAERCVGCGRCVQVCPSGAVFLKDGTARKCDGCYERRMAGLEPICTAACVNGSLRYGEMRK